MQRMPVVYKLLGGISPAEMTVLFQNKYTTKQINTVDTKHRAALD